METFIVLLECCLLRDRRWHSEKFAKIWQWFQFSASQAASFAVANGIDFSDRCIGVAVVSSNKLFLAQSRQMVYAYASREW